MRSSNTNYINLGENQQDRRKGTPWYWRLVALAASWMILGGFLLLPGMYAKDAQLKFSSAVLSVFVVALLTAGYSFTALLCFACRDQVFQAEGVFLPALTSSALGLVSIAYNFLSSHAYTYSTAAISGTVISGTGTLLYSTLLLWTLRRITTHAKPHPNRPRANPWSEQSYYTNFIANMYPTATTRSPSRPPSDDDRVNQQMALLLRHVDAQPSPDANSATYRIALPEDNEDVERHARSQELVGTPGPAYVGCYREGARPDGGGLGEQQAWERWQERGRTPLRPESASGQSSHKRNLSREERRLEIELGRS